MTTNNKKTRGNDTGVKSEKKSNNESESECVKNSALANCHGCLTVAVDHNVITPLVHC